MLNKIINKVVERSIRSAILPVNFGRKRPKKTRRYVDTNFFQEQLKFLFILSIAILMVLSEVGLEIGPILAGAGILGLAVGFGGQYLIRDIITGFFMIIENQYRIGDVVNFDGTGGLIWSKILL